MKTRSPLCGIRLLMAGMAVALVSCAFSVQGSLLLETQSRGPVVSVRTKNGTEELLYQESHALLIGVSEYTNGWRDLPGVKTDILDVKGILEKHGFQVEVSQNPTRTGFDEAITTFIRKWGQAGKNRLLIYFAGHGKTLSWEASVDDKSVKVEMGYLVPADTPLLTDDRGLFKQIAISMEQMQAYLGQVESRHMLLVFDSCFSGSFFNVRSDPGVPPQIMVEMANPVRQFITSGSADQEVPDDSTFRKEFVNALNGYGDLNNDGYVTGSELGMFLRNRVIFYEGVKQTPQYGKARKPEFDKGDFVFELPGNLERTIEKGGLLFLENGRWELVEDKTVIVPAASAWTSTLIKVEQEQKIWINTSGSQIDFGTFGSGGPDGVALSDPKRPHQGCPTGALIAKIGSQQACVGSEAEFRARASGELELGLNESRTADNAGSFIVKIRTYRFTL